MVQDAKTRLVDRTICEDLVIARFEKPPGYTFQPGQWLRLTLESDEGPHTRTLSHASTPDDDYIEVATRLSNSPFKRLLSSVPLGTGATLTGPAGRFTLPADPERAVFLLGGIGVTPAISLLRDSVSSGRKFEDLVVIYGNRSPRCVAYLDELQSMADSGVRCIPVFEKPDPGWQGESGFITPALVRRNVADIEERPFLVVGPPAMLPPMQAVLDELGIPDSRRSWEVLGEVPRKPPVREGE